MFGGRINKDSTGPGFDIHLVSLISKGKLRGASIYSLWFSDNHLPTQQAQYLIAILHLWSRGGKLNEASICFPCLSATKTLLTVAVFCLCYKGMGEGNKGTERPKLPRYSITSHARISILLSPDPAEGAAVEKSKR